MLIYQRVSTIYKAYFLGLNFRGYPPKIWPEIWYVYVPASIGSWRSPIDRWWRMRWCEYGGNIMGISYLSGSIYLFTHKQWCFSIVMWVMWLFTRGYHGSIHFLVGGWAYPSEKWWTSSVGMMTFPTEKKCSKPGIIPIDSIDRMMGILWEYIVGVS